MPCGLQPTAGKAKPQGQRGDVSMSIQELQIEILAEIYRRYVKMEGDAWNVEGLAEEVGWETGGVARIDDAVFALRDKGMLEIIAMGPVVRTTWQGQEFVEELAAKGKLTIEGGHMKLLELQEKILVEVCRRYVNREGDVWEVRALVSEWGLEPVDRFRIDDAVFALKDKGLLKIVASGPAVIITPRGQEVAEKLIG